MASNIEKTFDPTSESASEAVLEAVGALEDRPPAEFPRPLHASIESNALDSLIAHDGTSTRVTFHYERYLVTVESEGRVTVCVATDGESDRSS